ncbi:hypothetical protein F5H01DRAFT_197803 [Linnemannia elongata]|nr:hypothetical protein F5H01DRAFT_197803 [Linnemannia elongata]
MLLLTLMLFALLLRTCATLFFSFFFVLPILFFFEIHRKTRKRSKHKTTHTHIHTYTFDLSLLQPPPPRPSSLLPCPPKTTPLAVSVSQSIYSNGHFSILYLLLSEVRRAKGGAVLPSTFQRTIPLLFIFFGLNPFFLLFIWNGMAGMRMK